MTAATQGSQKDITALSGCQVVYLSTVLDGYTFDSRFGKVIAAFFQATTPGPMPGLSKSNGRITFAISGGITAGYLQVWGE